MTNRQIPSADNLLELAISSLKLVEVIRNYLPVDPEIIPQEPITDLDGFVTRTNVACIAQAAANADYRADEETRNRISKHVCG